MKHSKLNFDNVSHGDNITKDHEPLEDEQYFQDILSGFKYFEHNLYKIL
jgi:hypothetical protein